MASARKTPITQSMTRWAVALLGLFLLVMAILGLSGPGRIDIIDGQNRYYVARSLADHGDVVVREPNFNFLVFPGRDGNLYSSYRFPPILAGLPSILFADATGTVSETRREFFFTFTNAVVGALLAVVYAMWFRSLGHSPGMSLAWAVAGILCTPNWYYSTSTYDDILGGLFVVSAVTLAWWGKQGSHPLLASGLAGLAVGLAFNTKPPLGIFLLPVLALGLTAARSLGIRVATTVLVLGGVGLGLGAYVGYEWWKFPPGSTNEHARLLARYLLPWPGDTLAGVCGFLLSPAAGIFWYCPTLVLALAGLLRWRRREAFLCLAIAVSCTIFVLFISTMSFFKGDLSWGPRYLTPIFAVLWLFVPTAALSWPRRLTVGLLGLGLLVQLMALSVDPLRLFVSYRLPSGYFAGQEWIHFEPALGHILARPREILEICKDDGSATTEFCPDPRCTSTDVLLEEAPNGPEAVRRYRYLASFRPWWIRFAWLLPSERPVPLLPTAAIMLALALGGVGLMLTMLRGPIALAKRNELSGRIRDRNARLVEQKA